VQDAKVKKTKNKCKSCKNNRAMITKNKQQTGQIYRMSKNKIIFQKIFSKNKKCLQDLILQKDCTKNNKTPSEKHQKVQKSEKSQKLNQFVKNANGTIRCWVNECVKKDVWKKEGPTSNPKNKNQKKLNQKIHEQPSNDNVTVKAEKMMEKSIIK